MSLPTIILIGGGGHCISCIDVIESTGSFQIAGIIDLPGKRGEKILDIEIIGTDEDIPRLKEQFDYFFVTIGQIKSAQARSKAFDAIAKYKLNTPVIISPRARVSPHAKLGAGTIVMHGAVVNAGATTGEGCIINTNAIVEHEVKLGRLTHLSTGSICNGQCEIGDHVFIGSNAVLAQNISVGSNSIVGAGAVVLENVPGGCLAVGNPAIIKK